MMSSLVDDPSASAFWAERDYFRHRMQGGPALQAAEATAHYPAGEGIAPLDERLLQTIWAQQLIQAGGLRLADGRPLRVLDPGRWNGAAGPDFKGARLMFGETPIQGDVEIHIEPADWLRHGHARDLDYNSVILHVVLAITDGQAEDPLHNGATAPRLELEPYIFPDLETLRRSLSPDDYQYSDSPELGRCHRLMLECEESRVTRFLDRAGDERLFAKMRRLDESARQAGLEQVFYQALMMSLGAGAGKTLYYLLAKRAPLEEIVDFAREFPQADRPVAIETLLLHVAGLVPPPEALADAPDESRRRTDKLNELWRRFEPYWVDRVMPPTRRWFQGIRPVNFPTRRLAGVAVLIARAMQRGRLPLADLVERLEAGAPTLEAAVPRRKRHPLLKELADAFVVAGDGHFWATHYSFTAKPAARPMNLIGEGTAMSLVLNALLPAALLKAHRAAPEHDHIAGQPPQDETQPPGDSSARLHDAVHKLWALVPPLQANHITEFMTHRLFGDSPRAALINTERRRQGLFQIFYHCCNGQETNCDQCYYLAEDQNTPS